MPIPDKFEPLPDGTVKRTVTTETIMTPAQFNSLKQRILGQKIDVDAKATAISGVSPIDIAPIDSQESLAKVSEAEL